MQEPPVDSACRLKDFLRGRGLAAQKRYGQNFLINSGARKTLIDSLELSEGEEVWEIGAGLGTMTSLLLKAKAKVKAFEIDAGFCAALRDFFSGEKDFSLIEGDVIKTAFEEAKGIKTPVKLLGNLPYNIGARILALFIENNILFKKIAVTVQREVAERIASPPGSKNYSSLSVVCGLHYNIKLSSVLSGNSFYPVPNVDSRIVVFSLKEKTEKPPECFFRLVRTLFASRRKTVKNNLKTFLKNEFDDRRNEQHRGITGALKTSGEIDALSEALLSECSIKETGRAENLSVRHFLTLAGLAEELLCTRS